MEGCGTKGRAGARLGRPALQHKSEGLLIKLEGGRFTAEQRRDSPSPTGVGASARAGGCEEQGPGKGLGSSLARVTAGVRGGHNSKLRQRPRPRVRASGAHAACPAVRAVPSPSRGEQRRARQGRSPAGSARCSAWAQLCLLPGGGGQGRPSVGNGRQAGGSLPLPRSRWSWPVSRRAPAPSWPANCHVVFPAPGDLGHCRSGCQPCPLPRDSRAHLISSCKGGGKPACPVGKRQKHSNPHTRQTHHTPTHRAALQPPSCMGRGTRLDMTENISVSLGACFSLRLSLCPPAWGWFPTHH